MSINTTHARIGNPTSSEIVALTTKGKEKGSLGAPFYTYINECNIERKLLRSISDESSARPLIWGKVCEKVAFNTLGLEYSLCSQETIVHKDFDFWAGSPDGTKEDEEGLTVIDIKCPQTLKSFCTFYDCDTIEDVRNNHKDGDKYFWQLVSNAILTGARFAELVIYMPFLEELQDIREAAGNLNPQDLYKAFWIANGNDEELPHLISEGYYKNIKKIRFEVAQEDKDFLTERVRLAGTLLKPFHKTI